MIKKWLIAVTVVLVLVFACTGSVLADMVLDTKITITAPTAGEKLMVGSDYNIKWYTERGGYYQLSYSVDNGATWTSINATGIKLGHFETGSYYWKVPATPSSKVLIRAADMPIFGEDIFYNNSDVFSIIGMIDMPKLPGVISLPPAAPSNLTATTDLPASVVLTWSDNSSNESSFVIHRTTRSTSYEEIATTAANVNTFTDTTAEYGIAYFYKVKARNSAGDSDFTDETIGRLLIVPEENAPKAPTSLKATALSSTEVRLTWTDQAADEEGFYVERDGARIVTLASDAASFTDTGLAPGTEYEYRVQAFNGNGESAYSNTSVITTPGLVVTPPPTASGETTVMHFYIDNPDYFINGELNTMDAAPTIFEGRTVLPIKYVAEPLGAAVGWDPETKRVRINHQNRVIDLWIGNNRAAVNGVEEMIDPNNANVTPVVLPPGRTMLPLKFIVQQMGAQVEWDSVQRRVTITYPAPY